MAELTECYYISGQLAQYINQNICKRFLDTWNALIEEKIPPEHIKRGLALALAESVRYFVVTKNPGPEVREIINEIYPILEKSREKGGPFCMPISSP